MVTPPARIALIGLGNMGRPMGACLERAGFAVAGYDASLAARESFAAETGAGISADPEGAVRGASVIITMLPDGRIVRSVLEALRPHVQKGAIVIDMSSSAPLGTRELGRELIASGLRFIDAPVSGGVRRAVDGSLTIMAGGDGATIDAAEPVLKAMGRAIFRTGPLGSGHAMKALNNYVSAAGLLAACEAVNVGRAFGLDEDLMIEVLNASTGRNNSTELKMRQMVLSRQWNSGFSIGLMAKDIRAADQLAADLCVPTPLAHEVAGLWERAAADLGGSADHSEIQRFLERSARTLGKADL